MTNTDLPTEEAPEDLKSWLAALPNQQPGETYIQMKYRKLLAIQTRLNNIDDGTYEDWADARDSAEEEIAKHIAEKLEDVVIKLTCLSKNLRRHSDPRGLGPMLDLMLAESSLTGVREALVDESGPKSAAAIAVQGKVS